MLTLILHLFIGASLAGIAVMIALVSGVDDMTHILGTAALGFLLAIPVSIAIANRLR
jgi:adenine/guanine phosphoribosyltransferase-like PRPP-binding protein